MGGGYFTFCETVFAQRVQVAIYLTTIDSAPHLEASQEVKVGSNGQKIESAARTLRHFRTAARHDPKVANKWIFDQAFHSSRLCSLGSMPDRHLRHNFASVLFPVCYGVFPIIAPTPSPGRGHNRRFRDSDRYPVHPDPGCGGCPVSSQVLHRVIFNIPGILDQERETEGIWSLSTSPWGFRTSHYRRFIGVYPDRGCFLKAGGMNGSWGGRNARSG